MSVEAVYRPEIGQLEVTRVRQGLEAIVISIDDDFFGRFNVDTLQPALLGPQRGKNVFSIPLPVSATANKLTAKLELYFADGEAALTHLQLPDYDYRSTSSPSPPFDANIYQWREQLIEAMAQVETDADWTDVGRSLRQVDWSRVLLNFKTEDFVTVLFRLILDRDEAGSGFEFYCAELNRGRHPHDLVRRMLTSREASMKSLDALADAASIEKLLLDTAQAFALNRDTEL